MMALTQYGAWRRMGGDGRSHALTARCHTWSRPWPVSAGRRLGRVRREIHSVGQVSAGWPVGTSSRSGRVVARHSDPVVALFAPVVTPPAGPPVVRPGREVGVVATNSHLAVATLPCAFAPRRRGDGVWRGGRHRDHRLAPLGHAGTATHGMRVSCPNLGCLPAAGQSCGQFAENAWPQPVTPLDVSTAADRARVPLGQESRGPLAVSARAADQAQSRALGCGVHGHLFPPSCGSTLGVLPPLTLGYPATTCAVVYTVNSVVSFCGIFRHRTRGPGHPLTAPYHTGADLAPRPAAMGPSATWTLPED